MCKSEIVKLQEVDVHEPKPLSDKAHRSEANEVRDSLPPSVKPHVSKKPVAVQMQGFFKNYTIEEIREIAFFVQIVAFGLFFLSDATYWLLSPEQDLLCAMKFYLVVLAPLSIFSVMSMYGRWEKYYVLFWPLIIYVAILGPSSVILGVYLFVLSTIPSPVYAFVLNIISGVGFIVIGAFCVYGAMVVNELRRLLVAEQEALKVGNVACNV